MCYSIVIASWIVCLHTHSAYLIYLFIIKGCQVMLSGENCTGNTGGIWLQFDILYTKSTMLQFLHSGSMFAPSIPCVNSVINTIIGCHDSK